MADQQPLRGKDMSNFLAFDSTAYLKNNPDVLQAVLNGGFPSARAHFEQFGVKELRNPNAVVNLTYILTENADTVLAAIQSGAAKDVFDWYVNTGVKTGVAPNAELATFDSAKYLADNLDVKAAVDAGYFKSALEHYLAYGRAESRPAFSTDGTQVDEPVGNTIALTTGTDTLTGTAANDTFIGVADGVTSITVGAGQPVTQTFGGLDVVDGGAGTDTMRLTNEVGTMTLATSVTVKSIEKLELISADNAITADVSGWEGLQTITVDQKDNDAVAVTTKGNATGVSVTGGTTVAVTDSGAAKKDTLASVTVQDATGAITVASDVLTKLTLIESDGGATVTAAAGTRTLDLTINGLTAGTITDAEATGLKVTATGDASEGITLAAAKAKAIEFAGSESISVDIGNAAAQAANLVITSSNTAGVTLVNNALDTDVTFTGGAGKDSLTIGASTKTIDLGAGNDTLTVTAALGEGGKLVGGEGTDTLVMTSALAQTLTGSTAFSKAIEGFEKVSLGAVAADTTNTVNLTNLGNISHVVSAGTGAAGVAETAAIVFTTLSAGASITIAGRTVTATGGNATGAQVATAFSTGTSAGALTVTGTLTDWTAGAVTGASQVTFTSSNSGNVTDLTPTFTGVAAPVVPSVATTNGTGASDETAAVTFTDLAIGQSVTVAGLTISAVTGAATAAQVAAAVAGGSAGTIQVTGALADWTAAPAAGATVTFTSTTDNTDVPNLVPTVAGTPAPTVTSNTPTNGTPGSVLTVTNMANGGTFELTGAVTGTATVSLKDATGTADVLNVTLNGASNIVNTGKVVVAGVETINIVTTDTTAASNPAAASTINLDAAGTTKIVLTGNHGVNFTGSTLTKLVDLDASGVVGTGATAAAAATAGTVTFTSSVTDKALTVKTGNGNDTIIVASNTKGATIDTGTGNDTITGSQGNDVINAGAGNDKVNSSAGADTITLGDGNDTYVLVDTAHSVLAKYDTILDFKANTVLADEDDASEGAAALADRDGDVIDLNGLLADGADGIKVFVASNAADAQTFIQNTGNAAGDLTGFALDSSTNLLYMDFNQDGVVDSVIKLTGVTTITEAAFTGLDV
ncbi:beta strand repeat-containing protein [Rhodocista pekingensis]|uniref:Beta strand repeat-containing protein n=1 Tax=Rhodocista pekingensis TaxID=201185 RepID=A0ABW2KPB2_9PROT